MGHPEQPAGGAERRVIKRYSNRKLYDTTDSRYVTLQQIGEMVRRGEDVQIIDNKTKEDKTEVTLALILSEDLKNKPRSVPLGTLRTLIQERGNKVLTTLRGGPLGRLIPEKDDEKTEATAVDVAGLGGEPPAERVPPPPVVEEGPRKRLEGLVEGYRQGLDQFQANLDERMKTMERSLNPIRELRDEVERLAARLDAIEAHLGMGASRGPADVDQVD